MQRIHIFIALAVLSGCASVGIKRHVYDEGGRELATVSIQHPLATSESAVRLVESARRFEETKQDGDAERRTSEIAEKSVDNGKPTSVSTRGGHVQSGYGYGYGAYGYGYGAYGQMYDPYGYGAYGSGYNPTTYYPGADPNTVRIEAMWRRGMYQTLPPLGEPVTPYPTAQPGVPADPGANELRQDVDELLRIHRPKR